MDKLPAETLRAMQIIAGALMAGPVVLFGMVGLLRFLGTVPLDLPIVVYVASALAVLSPVVARAMRDRFTDGFAGEPLPAEKQRAAMIVAFGILEGGALSCGMAFLLTPTYWPLLAALVPLGTMALWFPRQ